MKEPRNILNIKSFLSAIDKINPIFKNQTNHRKYQKYKENYSKKMNQTEEFNNINLSKNENNSEYNIIYQTNNNNNSTNNQISLHKNTQNNFMHKRSLSKNIFNNINMNNFNSSIKKSNISSEKNNNNNSKEKNNPIIFINKSKGIVLNKVNIFKNVKFRKPSLSKHINKVNKIDSKINSNSINTNSNTNTIIQSLSSLNMTSTDVTASTKRIKDNNLLNIENKLNKEKDNNREINILRNNIMNFNQISESNTVDIIKNKKQNVNKNLFNITNINPNNPTFTNFNTNNNTNNTNSLYQFYKGILPKTNNLLNKNKKPKNINKYYIQ